MNISQSKLKMEIISIGATIIIGVPLAGIVYLEVMGKSILPELPNPWGGRLVEGLAFGIPYWLIIFSMIVIYTVFIHLVFDIPKFFRKTK